MKSRVSIMFPNAISLDLNVDGWELSGEGDDDDRWTPLLPIIVGPNVREISLKAYEITERVFQDNINTLARVAPEIHTVVIKNFPDAFSPGDFPFTQMRYLRVSSFIPHKSWRALANHPCLETIELAGFVAKPTDFTMNPQNAPIKLSHLKVLYVGYCFSGTDPKFAVALFRNTIMPALRILEVGDQDNGEHLLSPWKSAREDMLKYVREHSPMLEEFSIYGLVGSGSGG
ncbi:hypothetical protein FRB95_002581 [Tulasnella sp. JGI-2019a]|nr:hypothetical protein FRB95_002581 [Tulasnella sp. JGI-2019a]